VELGQPYFVYFYCPLSESFHQYTTHFCIYIIFLQDVQRGETTGSSRNNALQNMVVDKKFLPPFRAIQSSFINQAVKCQPVCPEARFAPGSKYAIFVAYKLAKR